MNNAVKHLVINKDTGEVIDSIEEGDKFSITRKKKIDFMENTIEIPFKSFVKLNTKEIGFLSKELSKSDFAFLLSLCDFVGFYDNCIKNRRGDPMSIDEIALKLDIPRSTAYRIVNKLIDESILCKAKTSEFQLFVCPLIFCKGNRANRVLQTMFRNYKVRSFGGVKWEKLIKQETG